MMNSFPDWESSQTKEKSSDFTKKVSFWHKNTLDDTMKHMATTHNPPSFVPTRDFEPESSFDLHTILLNQVSSLLIQSYEAGLSQQTSQKIVEWFLILNDPSLSSLTDMSSEETECKFNSLCYKFDNLSNCQQHPQDKDFPFFCPQILFIYITHLVSLYTKSTDGDNYHVHISDSDSYSDWEEISGSIIQNNAALDLKTDGLTILLKDHETLSDKSHPFGPINLPYQEWSKKTEKLGSVPSPEHLQESVIGEVLIHISRKLSQHRINACQPEYYQFMKLCTKMQSLTKQSTRKLKNQEKQRRHHRAQQGKKYEAEHKTYNYKPRPPKYFQPDIYTMGHQSYYYQFLTKDGRVEHDLISTVMASHAHNDHDGTLTQCVVS